MSHFHFRNECPECEKVEQCKCMSIKETTHAICMKCLNSSPRNNPNCQDYIKDCIDCGETFTGYKGESVCYICNQPKISAVDIYLGK